MALEKLIKAIEITTPNFSMSNYDSFIYSTMEIRILMNTGLLLDIIESTEKSLEIMEFCFKSMEPMTKYMLKYATICLIYITSYVGMKKL
ncbi:hypothetical protein [Proteiniborus sp. MB09-C3]|uniref:hypothetical protein n=1 Tax=Proteiniborus sp. MB09-C3 TaxID=3050072 RepID=UPI0025531D6C|nr:hypothetical protein [Proteiniborus sp. MB09-C3]WIV11844.1 hypothetical protein QO263_17330 [Proteiniborus sp. MB09-C3]